MPISASEIRAKGEAVRDKATAVWLQKNWEFFPSDEMTEVYGNQVREAFEFIATMFESHARRDPADVESMRSYLDNLRRTFEEPSITGAVDTVKDYVSDWRGDAAFNFREDYLEPFEEIHANQRYLVNMLDGTLEAVETMLANGRTDIMDIGDSALAALDAVEESGGGGGGGLSLGLTIVAAVFTVLTAVPTAGASATVTFAVLAGASSIGASVASYQGQGTTITGETVEDVVNRLVEASNALWETKNAVEQDLADKLSEDLTNVQLEWHKYQPPRPDISGFGNSDQRSLEVLGEFVPPA